MTKGIASVCVTHPAVEAIGRCKVCNKPFCGACRVQGPTGNFCSQACKEKHEAYVQRAQQLEERKPSFFKGSTFRRWVKRGVILVVVLLIVSVVAAFMDYDIPLIGGFGRWVRNLTGR